MRILQATPQHRYIRSLSVQAIQRCQPTISSEMALLLPTLGRFCLLAAVLRRLRPWDRSEYSDRMRGGKVLCSTPPGGIRALGGWSGMQTTVPGSTAVYSKQQSLGRHCRVLFVERSACRSSMPQPCVILSTATLLLTYVTEFAPSTVGLPVKLSGSGRPSC